MRVEKSKFSPDEPCPNVFFYRIVLPSELLAFLSSIETKQQSKQMACLFCISYGQFFFRNQFWRSNWLSDSISKCNTIFDGAEPFIGYTLLCKSDQNSKTKRLAAFFYLFYSMYLLNVFFFLVMEA